MKFCLNNFIAFTVLFTASNSFAGSAFPGAPITEFVRCTPEQSNTIIEDIVIEGTQDLRLFETRFEFTNGKKELISSRILIVKDGNWRRTVPAATAALRGNVRSFDLAGPRALSDYGQVELKNGDVINVFCVKI